MKENKIQKRSVRKKIVKIVLWILATIFGLLFSVFLIFKIPAVQDWAAQKTASYLENKLHTKVLIGDVTIDLFKHVILNELYLEDLNNDTLLYAKKFEINLGALNPLKPSIYVKKIQVENASINLNRNFPDTLFNYQFIIDAFSTKNSSASSSKPIDIDLQTIILKEVCFSFHDEVGAKEIVFNSGKTELFFNQLDLINNVLAIEKIELEDAQFNLIALKENKIDSITPSIENNDVVHIALNNWICEFNLIELKSCGFIFIDQNSKSHFDGINFSDLDIQEINLDFEEITYLGDTVKGEIIDLQLMEKSGFQLNQLQSSFLFSPYEITLKNLQIGTLNSSISNFFSLKYNTLNDFDQFESKVSMQGNFVQSKVSSKDIAFFAPELNQYPVDIVLDGNIQGQLDNLKSKNLQLNVNKNTVALHVDANIKGLPNISNTFFDLKIESLEADLNKVNAVFPSPIISENIIALQQLKYEGRFTGFIDDFVLNGILLTPEGSASTDINYKYVAANNSSELEGKVAAVNFPLGQIIGNKKVFGNANFALEVNGTFSKEKIDGKISGDVSNIEINQYNYQNIKVEGKVIDKYFNGHLFIDDKNLKQEFNGVVDLNKDTPTFDFVTEVEYAHLKNLGLYDKEIEISLKAAINATGHTLNDILGTMVITDIYISDNESKYNLEELNIIAGGDLLNRSLTVRSDLLDANFTGSYNLQTLPIAIRDMINIYLEGEVSKAELLNAQEVSFDLNIKNVQQVTQIFIPDIEVLKNVKVEGELNTKNKKIFTRVTADQVTYKGISFLSSAVEIFSSNDKLKFFTKVKEIQLSNNLTMPVTVLEGDFSKNNMNLNLKCGRDIDSERMNLFAGVFIDDSIVKVNILPSEIFLKNERWEIESNNSLIYDYKSFTAENFNLVNGDKKVNITSSIDQTYGPILKLKINNLLIQDITQLFKKQPNEIKGTINANINIGSIFSKPEFVGVSNIKGLTIDNQIIGDLDITSSLIYPNPKISFNIMLKGENNMRLYGMYKIDGSDSVSVDGQISKVPLKIAEPFMTGIFSNMSGDINGDVKLRGTLNQPELKGFVEIKKGGLIIDYLNAQYYFNFQKVEITKEQFFITPNKINDRFENEGNLSGFISHQNFQNFYFHNLVMSSDKILFMETTYKTNPDFYGNAIGKAKVVIDGPLEKLNFIVEATPVSDENFETSVYLPTFGSGSVSKHDFIRFVNTSSTNPVFTNVSSAGSIINFDMTLNINPQAKIIILLSSDGNDTLYARGNGILNINANTIDKLEMNGKLSINEGSYNFSFENLLQKEFKLLPNGSIEFVNDPYQAELNLTAAYVAERVDKNTLTGETGNAQIADITVLIKITGKLEAPEINFDLLVSNNATGTLSSFDQKFAAMKEDKNELNKQVFGLLLANQFIGGEITQANPLQNSVNNTMTDFISNQLSSYFTDWLSEIFPDAEIDIGYTKLEDGNIIQGQSQRQEFDLAVKKRLLDDQITIKIGGTYDYSDQSSSEGSISNLAGDFEIEYNITEDGRIRIKAFRKSEYDVIGVKNDILTGVGIFYTKDFNSFAELFASRKKSKN